MPELRQIDALVAEHVMGLVPQKDFGRWDEHEWKRTEDGEIDYFGIDYDYHNGPVCVRCGYGYCKHCQDGPDEPCVVEPPPYSSDIAAAWQVVERMAEMARTATEANAPAEFRAARAFINWWKAERLWILPAPEAARRICLAALRAVGVEVPTER